MGTDISAGLVFVDGMLVHDAELNAAIGDSTILPTAISSKTLKTTLSLGDEFLINDGGSLKKTTGQQIVEITKMPAGCMMDYAGATEPLGWVFCYGQALSRTTYADLFTAIGTAYGTGDGATTFNVPDLRGRIGAGRDNMGGTAANRITNAVMGFDATVLGNQGGSQSHTLTAAESGTNVPAHTHPGVDHLHSLQNHTHTMDHRHHCLQPGYPGATNAPFGSGISFGSGPTSYMSTSDGQGTQTQGPSVGTTGSADRALTTGASTAVNTAATNAHRNLQPTMIFNKIIKT